MPKSDTLGQFEQLVLTAIVGLEAKAYGVTVHQKVQELSAGKRVTLAAIYVALDRLEQKGMVASWLSEPTEQRGGRRKRCYRIEPLGERALKDSIATAERVARAVAKVWGRPRVEWSKA